MTVGVNNTVVNRSVDNVVVDALGAVWRRFAKVSYEVVVTVWRKRRFGNAGTIVASLRRMNAATATAADIQPVACGQRSARHRVETMPSKTWTTVCELDALLPNVGVRALLGDSQVAVFRLSGSDEIFAIDAFDPFSNAPVLSRGIVGDVKGRLVVASPIYKQHFDLTTGQCLEDDSVAVRTFAVRVVDGQVQVRH